jgi:hypothetical protein
MSVSAGFSTASLPACLVGCFRRDPGTLQLHRVSLVPERLDELYGLSQPRAGAQMYFARPSS